MDFDSSFFDNIRIKPNKGKGKGKKQTAKEEHPTCQWEGCNEPAPHRAPKGRGQEGKYLNFCMKHVREYNNSYNYFKGMSDDDIKTYQKDSITGHRPTWSMGTHNTSSSDNIPKSVRADQVRDGFGFVGGTKGEEKPEKPRRHVRNMERKSLVALNLDETATPEDIKARYKELVKRHHPDTNGGDRSLEDKLREIINAYNYLKKTGFC